MVQIKKKCQFFPYLKSLSYAIIFGFWVTLGKTGQHSMPGHLTIQGIPFTSPEDLFEKFQSSKAKQYVSKLKEKRYSYSEIPDKARTIGTLDATSCLGIVYRVPNQSIYVQHHDGRPLESLLEIFDKNEIFGPIPMQVTLIGGCKTSNHYASIEKHTKENFERLIEFWIKHQFHIDLQGWAAGDDYRYDALCSDFIVGKDQSNNEGQFNSSVWTSFSNNYFRLFGIFFCL